MRKILITLLLASAAATPALAGPDDHDRQQARQERQQAHEERQQARQESHAERAAPAFVGRSSGPPPQAQVEAPNHPQFVGNPNAGDMRAMRDARRAERFDSRGDRGNFSRGDQGVLNEAVSPGPHIVTVPAERGTRGGRMVEIEQNRQDRIDARELRQSNRALPNVMRDRHPLVVSNVPRPGTQPPLRVDSRRLSNIRWSTNWRNDHRYDWRNYRRHHHSLFHLGLFIDPFGWDYFPFDIGYRMWPSYYGNQYWIDPSLYQLPYPPPGCVWIRYWNDAILVDTYSGTVIDVIPNFFW